MGKKYSYEEVDKIVCEYFRSIQLKNMILSYSSFEQCCLNLYEEPYLILLEKMCNQISLKNPYPDFFIDQLYNFMGSLRSFYQKNKQVILKQYSLSNFTERFNRMLVQLNVPSHLNSVEDFLKDYFQAGWGKIQGLKMASNLKNMPLEKQRDLCKRLYQYMYQFLRYLLVKNDFSDGMDVYTTDVLVGTLGYFIKDCSFLFYYEDTVRRTFNILLHHLVNLSNENPNFQKVENLCENVKKIYIKKKW